MKRALALFTICLLAGCVHPLPNGYETSTFGTKYNTYEVKIVSLPEGATIVWNGEEIGTTPLTHTLTGWAGREPENLPKLSNEHIVIAHPTGPRQFPQLQRFANPVPRTIYFDMYIPEKN